MSENLVPSAEWRNFQRSQIWEAILEELKDWEERVKTEYDVCTELHHLGKIQGRIEALGYLRQLPSMKQLDAEDLETESSSGEDSVDPED